MPKKFVDVYHDPEKPPPEDPTDPGLQEPDRPMRIKKGVPAELWKKIKAGTESKELDYRLCPHPDCGEKAEHIHVIDDPKLGFGWMYEHGNHRWFQHYIKMGTEVEYRIEDPDASGNLPFEEQHEGNTKS